MAPRTRVLRDQQGNERVLLDLADFQGLLDAARGAAGGPDSTVLVQRLAEALNGAREDIELDAFLAEYDAAHGEDS